MPRNQVVHLYLADDHARSDTRLRLKLTGSVEADVMTVTLNGVALDWATCKITRHGGGGDIFAWAEFLVDPELLRCGSNDIGVAVLSRPSNLVASVVLQSVEVLVDYPGHAANTEFDRISLGSSALNCDVVYGFNAIVFDFDGLIVDTEVPEYEAWLGIFRSYGVDLPLSGLDAAHRGRP